VPMAHQNHLTRHYYLGDCSSHPPRGYPQDEIRGQRLTDDRLGLVLQWGELVVRVPKSQVVSRKMQTVDANVSEMVPHSLLGNVGLCLLSCLVSAGRIQGVDVAMESLGLEGSGAY
jgi:hypothetical protein